MQNHKSFITFFLIGLTLCIGFLMGTDAIKTAEADDLTLTPGTPIYHVLAIDMSRTGVQDKSQLILGKDPILMIAKKGTIENGEIIGAKANDAIYLFNDSNSLAQLDTDRNLMFLPGDEPFPNFLLGFYNPFTKTLMYHVASEYTISRIVLDKDYLIKDYSGDISRLNQPVGSVMLNGQSYAIKAIAMPQSFFDTLKMLPSDPLIALVKSKKLSGINSAASSVAGEQLPPATAYSRF